MVKTVKFFLTLLLTASISGCAQQDQRTGHKLQGNWSIDRYQRSEIRQDGSEHTFLDEKNVGFWEFRKSDVSTMKFLDFDFEYNGKETAAIIKGTAFISDEGKRLIIPMFLCNKPIGCDQVFTIQLLTKSKLVIEVFSFGDMTGDRVHPIPIEGSENQVYKLRMEMRKK